MSCNAAPIKDERIGHKIVCIEQPSMETRCDGLVEGFLPKESRRSLDELALSVGHDPLLLEAAPSCGIWTHEVGMRARGGRLECEHAAPSHAPLARTVGQRVGHMHKA